MTNKETNDSSPTKLPSLGLALAPILILILLLFITIRVFGSDALSGGSQISLLIAT
ncbi:MAG: sodium:proton antiporter, partial [Massilibacteroides sp.]|nr:sodium:proton antiporter [Massilibacteroides sp.]